MLQIPGRVSFKEDRIEFVAVAADIQPANFVGVRYLVEKPVRPSQELLCKLLPVWSNSHGSGTTSLSTAQLLHTEGCPIYLLSPTTKRNAAMFAGAGVTGGT